MNTNCSKSDLLKEFQKDLDSISSNRCGSSNKKNHRTSRSEINKILGLQTEESTQLNFENDSIKNNFRNFSRENSKKQSFGSILSNIQPKNFFDDEIFS